MAGQLVTALSIETDDGPVPLLLTGRRGVRSTPGIAGIGVRPVVTPRAGRHGSANRTRRRSDRVITVTGHVTGPDADGAWDEYDAVARALAGSIDTDRLLFYTLGTGRELQATVRLEELSPGVEVGPDLVRYQATLRKADPAAYSQALKVASTGDLVTPPPSPPMRIATNLITNPSFEVDTAGWSTNASGYWVNSGGVLTRFAGGSSAGAYYADLAMSNAGLNSMGGMFTRSQQWVAGQPYTFSMLLYHQSGNAAVQLLAGAGSANSANSYITVASGGKWTRYSLTWTPSTTYTGNAYFGLRNQNGVGVASEIGINAAMLVASATLPAYFDGDTAKAAWTGPPHNSTSELYDRRVTGRATFPITFPFTFRDVSLAALEIDNRGTISTPALIDLNGYLKDPIVDIDGRRLVIEGVIAQGDVLTLDTADRSVTLNGTGNRLNLLDTIQSRWVDLPARITVVQLIPADFAGSARMDIRYRDAYQ